MTVGEFVRAYGLPGSFGDGDPAGWAELPVPETIEQVLRALPPPSQPGGVPGAADRPGGVAWWRTLAEAWQEADLPELARACARQAWQLAQDGEATTWPDLQSIAELLAQLDPGDQAPPDTLGRLTREPHEAKQERLSYLFGRSDQGGRVNAVRELEDVERLVMCTYDPDLGTTTRLWHRTGYHTLVIEQFFAHVTGQPLTSWLRDNQEPLIWCGWSLHRLGDRATARACFKLAIALESEQPPEQQASQDEQDSSEPRRDAYDYLARFPATDGQADAAETLPPGFAQYARLASWLEERGLHGYLPWLVQIRPQSDSRIRKSTVTLPIHAIGRRNGWYLDHIRALDHPDYQSLAGMLDGIRLDALSPISPITLPAGPRPITSRPAAAAATAWVPPRPAREVLSDHDTAASVPIGVAEVGGRASLRIQPRQPVLLVQVPDTDVIVRTVADHLASHDWAVLCACPAGQRVGDADRWHRIRLTGGASDISEFWLRELAGFHPLRQAIGRCLRDLLPVPDSADPARCADPAAAACIDAALASADDEDAAELLLTGGIEHLKVHAAEIVDRTARLAFAGPADLRRAATLHEITFAALAALRAAVYTSWIPPSRPQTDSGPLIRVELPDGAADAALLTTLTVGSLLRSAEPGARPPEPAPAADWSAEVRARQPEPDQTTGHSAEDADLDFAIEVRPRDSPWILQGVTPAGHNRRLCIVVSGPAAEPVLSWFQPGGLAEGHVLITCVPEPTDAVMKTASSYHSILTGQLPPDLRSLLEIGAGVWIPAGLTEDLGRHGAVQVRAGDAGQRAERLVIAGAPGSGR